MQVLFDTSILSELLRKVPANAVVAYVETCERPLLSTVAFHELAFGVARMRDEVAKARLEDFVERLRIRFKDRVVAVDSSILATSGRLRAAAVRQRRALSQMDSLIAASAITRSATLATRNIGEFDWLEIPLVDPWRQVMARRESRQ